VSREFLVGNYYSHANFLDKKHNNKIKKRPSLIIHLRIISCQKGYPTKVNKTKGNPKKNIYILTMIHI